MIDWIRDKLFWVLFDIAIVALVIVLPVSIFVKGSRPAPNESASGQAILQADATDTAQTNRDVKESIWDTEDAESSVSIEDNYNDTAYASADSYDEADVEEEQSVGNMAVNVVLKSKFTPEEPKTVNEKNHVEVIGAEANPSIDLDSDDVIIEDSGEADISNLTKSQLKKLQAMDGGVKVIYKADDSVGEISLNQKEQQPDAITPTITDGSLSFNGGSDNWASKLEAVHIDKNYNPKPIKLSAEDWDLTARLVYGEAGNEGYIGQLLVAQTIRDTMIVSKTTNLMTIKEAYKYSGRIDKGTSESCKKAVKAIFDEGGYAVKHELRYFYAPALCDSAFHESQLFIVEYKGHRFFAPKKK